MFNTGNTPVTIIGATMSGTGFNIDFSIFPLTIPVNAGQPFTVTFTPTAQGLFTGSLTFNTSASGTQPVVALSGAGGSASGHTASLSWSASSSTVVGYNIYRSVTQGGLYTKLNGILQTQTTFVDTNLISGKTYYWVVTSVDASGNESGYSNEVAAIVP
jgi:hypothetical protein